MTAVPLGPVEFSIDETTIEHSIAKRLLRNFWGRDGSVAVTNKLKFYSPISMLSQTRLQCQQFSAIDCYEHVLVVVIKKSTYMRFFIMTTPEK